LTVDEEAIKAEVRELMKTFQQDIQKTNQAAALLEPYYREMYLKAAGRDVGMNRWLGSISR
jgi:5-methylthioadenosine/S-adenosylhomocysteine deaminase